MQPLDDILHVWIKSWPYLLQIIYLITHLLHRILITTYKTLQATSNLLKSLLTTKTPKEMQIFRKGVWTHLCKQLFVKVKIGFIRRTMVSVYRLPLQCVTYNFRSDMEQRHRLEKSKTHKKDHCLFYGRGQPFRAGWNIGRHSNAGR